jgi:phosphoglucosamine mutase
LIEDHILRDGPIKKASESIRKTGRRIDLVDGEKQYADFLSTSVPEGCNFNEMTIVLDCANGATYKIAPNLFAGLGASVEALFTIPDGENINFECGSQHPEFLVNRVLELNAHIGLAFDGDGDRMVAVDEKGHVLTGDHILAICAQHFKENGVLRNNTVVSTVMSNMGLGKALQNMGIQNEIAGVGDRYVLEKMVATDAVLGGEESGHTVFLNHQTTGDGLLSALTLLQIMVSEKRPLSDLKSVMTIFPQVLINVDVMQKPPLDELPDVQAVIRQVEKELAGKGRVLVRYSGTQPQCRIMVEGPNADDTQKYSNKIAQVIKTNIGR